MDMGRLLRGELTARLRGPPGQVKTTGYGGHTTPFSKPSLESAWQATVLGFKDWNGKGAEKQERNITGLAGA